MVEVLQSDESEVNSELNEAISAFTQEEVDFQKDIFNELQQVEKIWNNKVRFPYTSNEHECSLILEKKGNTIFVKLEKIPTYMWNPMDNEFKKEEKKQWLTGKTLDARSSEIFLTWLGKALDVIIGKWRVSAAEKAEEAYTLLWFTIE